MKSRTRASRTLCGYRKAQARATRIDFTAGSYVSHSVRFVQAHSLESGVCENGSVFGEKRGRFRVPVRATLVDE
jgi:hypothetical protein